MSKSLPPQVVGIVLGTVLLFIVGGIMAYLYTGTAPEEASAAEVQLNTKGITEMSRTDSNVFESIKSLHQPMTAEALEQSVTYDPNEVGRKDGVISPVLK